MSAFGTKHAYRVAGVPALFVVAAGCFVAACAGPPANTGQAGPAEPIGRLDNVLTGSVIQESDVEGFPDTTFSHGTVYVLPLNAIRQLSGDPNPQPPEAEELQYLKFSASRDELERLAIAHGLIEKNGRYRITAEAGDWAVCLADIQPEVDNTAPAQIWGCGPVRLPGPAGADVDLSFGEAGVGIWRRKP